MFCVYTSRYKIISEQDRLTKVVPVCPMFKNKNPPSCWEVIRKSIAIHEAQIESDATTGMEDGVSIVTDGTNRVQPVCL
jgi:hypothetical protein